jgi:hypothetical protein
MQKHIRARARNRNRHEYIESDELNRLRVRAPAVIRRPEHEHELYGWTMGKILKKKTTTTLSNIRANPRYPRAPGKRPWGTSLHKPIPTSNNKIILVLT